MNKTIRPLHWLILAWLALAPALAAAHQADHAALHGGSDLSCVLCHAGDRDDDGILPSQVVLPRPEAPRLAPEVTVPGLRLSFPGIAQPRGPPLSA